jgi:zinc-ribbon domain
LTIVLPLFLCKGIAMYCPNCGSQIAEATKFCRQCGLPLNQLAEYVASGGTAPLLSPPLNKTVGGLTPKQQFSLTIMLIVFSPMLFGVIGHLIGWNELAAIPIVLMPLGILWANFRYKNQLRQLKDQQMQQMEQHFQPQSYQSPLQVPPTNPMADPASGSVTEAETERLLDRRQ